MDSFCFQCGEPVLGTDKFCRHCGSSLHLGISAGNVGRDFIVPGRDFIVESNSKLVDCYGCNGTGYIGKYKQCSSCEGLGYTKRSYSADGWTTESYMRCHWCRPKREYSGSFVQRIVDAYEDDKIGTVKYPWTEEASKKAFKGGLLESLFDLGRGALSASIYINEIAALNLHPPEDLRRQDQMFAENGFLADLSRDEIQKIIEYRQSKDYGLGWIETGRVECPTCKGYGKTRV